MPWSKRAPLRPQRCRQNIAGFAAPRRNDPHRRRKSHARSGFARFGPATDGREPDRAWEFPWELTALKELACNKRRFLTILGPFRPARVLAPEGSLWQEPAA